MSVNGKRASSSSSSSSSSSESGAPKLDVSQMDDRGRNNSAYRNDEDDIPPNQTYYADELIDVPDLGKVRYFPYDYNLLLYLFIIIFFFYFMQNIGNFILNRNRLASAPFGLSPARAF